MKLYNLSLSHTFVGFFVSRLLGLLLCNFSIMKRFLPLLILTSLLFGKDNIEIAKQIVNRISNHRDNNIEITKTYSFYKLNNIDNNAFKSIYDTSMNHNDYLLKLEQFLKFHELLLECDGNLSYVEDKISNELDFDTINHLRLLIRDTKFQLNVLTKENKGGEVVLGEKLLIQLITVLNIIEEQDDPFFKL